jgi:hypothetical protein
METFVLKEKQMTATAYFGAWLYYYRIMKANTMP